MRLELAQRFQNVQKRVRRVRVIDEDLKLAFRRNHFETSGNLGRFGEAENGLAQTNPQCVRSGEGADRIRHVKATNQRNAHEVTFSASVELIRGTAKFHPIIRCAKIGLYSRAKSCD